MYAELFLAGLLLCLAAQPPQQAFERRRATRRRGGGGRRAADARAACPSRRQECVCGPPGAGSPRTGGAKRVSIWRRENVPAFGGGEMGRRLQPAWPRCSLCLAHCAARPAPAEHAWPARAAPSISRQPPYTPPPAGPAPWGGVGCPRRDTRGRLSSEAAASQADPRLCQEAARLSLALAIDLAFELASLCNPGSASEWLAATAVLEDLALLLLALPLKGSRAECNMAGPTSFL